MDNYKRNNRIAEALRIRGMKQVDLIERTGIPKGSLSSYIAQKWQPKQKPLMTMAKVLDVSELWLAGYDVPMGRAIEQKKLDELAQLTHRVRENEDFRELCISISKLNPGHYEMIKNMVNEFNKINLQ